MASAEMPELLFIDAVRSCWLHTAEDAKTNKTGSKAKRDFIVCEFLVEECISIG